MQAPLKLLDIARDRQKTFKKRERKTKNEKTINTLLLLVLYLEKLIFC